jgi:sortase A
VVRRRGFRPTRTSTAADSGLRAPSARPWLRIACLAAGSALILFVLFAKLDAFRASRDGLGRFAAARGSAGELPPGPFAAPPGALPVDQSLWAEGRRVAYHESLSTDLGVPVAVLRIPRLALEVPVWRGADELTLNRGLGLIPGTATPGSGGNVALAGHRDGYFRVLKDIAVGDELELETLAGVERYAVEGTWIVEPAAVWVLGPTPAPAVTLVTCYPFYFVGKAPRRFIVRASPRPGDRASSNDGEARGLA